MSDISHDLALDLAADALDFELSPTERRNLDDHLTECDACRDEASFLAEDDGWLETGFDWRSMDDDQDSGEADEFSPVLKRDPDAEDSDEDEAVTVVDATDVESIRGAGGDEEEADLLLGDPDVEPPENPAASPGRDDDDDDDGLDDDEYGSEPGGEADASTDGDDDDEAAAADDAEGDELEESTGGGQSDGDREVDDDDELDGDGAASAEEVDDLDADDESAIAAEADAFADGLDDAALGGVESAAIDATLDELFKACTADMVDDAAHEHGAAVGPDSHERAEKIVRSRDGMARTDFGTVAVYRSTNGLRQRRDQWHVDPQPSPTAAAAVRNAILRSRLGRGGVERKQARGRLDSMSLHRLAEKDPRLFKRPITPTPGKFLVWVMVDVSGSMSGYPVAQAAAVARALADATIGTPTVRLAVWGWSDPFIYESRYSGAVAGVVKVWEKGASQTTESIFDLTRLRMGGTPDAAVLAWGWREILKHAHPGERPVIFMCSDGWGDPRLPQVIEQARKHRVDVKNVALGNYVHELDQVQRFGRGNYVPWMGSIGATARPLATMVAKMAAGE